MPTELPNLIEKLKMDHQAIRDLFDRFQQADDRARQGIAEQALMELEIHSNLEEDLIYPAIRQAVGDDNMINEALEEHHVVSMLGRELRAMQANDERYTAKFKVLSDIVLRHIQQEESRTFPQAEKSQIDWKHLGKEATALRDELTGRIQARGPGSKPQIKPPV